MISHVDSGVYSCFRMCMYVLLVLCLGMSNVSDLGHVSISCLFHGCPFLFGKELGGSHSHHWYLEKKMCLCDNNSPNHFFLWCSEGRRLEGTIYFVEKSSFSSFWREDLGAFNRLIRPCNILACVLRFAAP